MDPPRRIRYRALSSLWFSNARFRINARLYCNPIVSGLSSAGDPLAGPFVLLATGENCAQSGMNRSKWADRGVRIDR